MEIILGVQISLPWNFFEILIESIAPRGEESVFLTSNRPVMCLWGRAWRALCSPIVEGNVFNQSAHLFTVSISNQNTQKTIENEEKIASDRIRKQRPNHMLFAAEKNSSNNVERRMEPLSKAVSGVILPHNAFEIHSDSPRRIINGELEDKNVKVARQTLAEIWNKFIWMTFLLQASMSKGTHWIQWQLTRLGVLLTAAFRKIVKCAWSEYCVMVRTSWLRLFPNRFLSAPVPFRQSCHGPLVPSIQNVKSTDWFLGLWERKVIKPLVRENSLLELPFGTFCHQ